MLCSSARRDEPCLQIVNLEVSQWRLGVLLPSTACRASGGWAWDFSVIANGYTLIGPVARIHGSRHEGGGDSLTPQSGKLRITIS